MGWWFMCLHFLLFHFSSSSSSSNFLCHHEESTALHQFKFAFTIDPYSCDKSLKKTTTWRNGTDCCSWHGVTCNTSSGHVIALNLGCEGLQGIIQSNNTLFHLAHLQSLNLSFNDFSYSLFHSKFGGFARLKHLDLSSSYFQGEVPTQISHLSKLESLHLSENDEIVWKETTLKRLVQNATNLKNLILDGTNMSSIRSNSMDLIFNQSSSLVTLNFRDTKLRGSFKILCLPSIQELYMSSNELEGQLPKFRCSASLRALDLSSCEFQGPLPLSFSNSNFTQLTSLLLSSNQLNGSISPTLLTLPNIAILDLKDNKFSGQIPNVFHLSNKLKELDLSDNKIGGELPTSLSNLQHLIRLDVSSNSFRGQIPDVFGGMTKLQQLTLNSNDLEGQIPSSLFNLTQLVTLDCSHNKLEGLLPNKFTGLKKLSDLRLNDNLLNGTIPPSLLSLPSLIYLYLSNNRFTGNISAISSHSLEELYLNNNRLQGSIPKSIFNLVHLTKLCLSSNNLSGILNFQFLSNLQSLQVLSLSHNSQLSINFESNVGYSFYRISKLDLSSVGFIKFPPSSENFLNLHSLDLSNNKLNGSVPKWLLGDSLSFLNLSQNLFTSIDQILRNTDQHSVNVLDLSFNLLVGDISWSICSMESLELLNLAYNKLTGMIPQCLVNLPTLLVLDLQMNKFNGTFPNNFSKDNWLYTLNLNGNQLEGHLPKSLSNCTNLRVLNLGSNKIEDTFPDWLQTLHYLEVLVLGDNKLHGPIPNLKFNHQFPNLNIFDISGNKFSGMLPANYLENFEAMKNVFKVGTGDNSLQYMIKVISVTKATSSRNAIVYAPNDAQYYDSVTVETKGIKTTLVKIPEILVYIDLSRNKFEGEIPNVIGELQALIGLNLSHNRFTGPIPKSMGNLENLEWLDLSSNMLTEVIPATLTNMGFLEFLDLSNNHLVGEIPQGKQFNTFSNDSYEGNSGLCGFPLSMKCGPEQHSPPSPNNFLSREKFGFGWKPVVVGYGCGMIFGIGLGYWVFLVGKPRWLVMIFGGQPKSTTQMRRGNGSTMTQMVQMS